MAFADFFNRVWQAIAGWALLLEVVITVATLLWVLHIKREPMSAIAWSLTVLLIPFLGAFLFYLFGYQTIHRPLKKRHKRKKAYRSIATDAPPEAKPGDGSPPVEIPRRWEGLARLAHHPDGFPVTPGNRLDFYHHGEPAQEAMLTTISQAKHHVHMQFFIFRPDDSGRRFIHELTVAVRRGVQVRFLYDSVGSYNLPSRMFRELKEAGGKTAAVRALLNPPHQ